MKFSRVENFEKNTKFPCLLISKIDDDWPNRNERFVILAKNETHATIVMAFGLLNCECVGTSFDWSADKYFQYELFNGSITLSND